MKLNMKNKKSEARFLLRVSTCLALLLIVFLLVQGHITNDYTAVYAAEQTETSNEKDFCYLSDIPYDATQSRAGWDQIRMDKINDGSLISVKVEGAYYTYQKGIWAHATSTIVYDLTNYSQYDYFTAYLGLNQTAGSQSNGVIYKIYTSVNGTNWEQKYNVESVVSKRGENADFAKIDIKDAKFLKLVADANGGNGGDHAVYADAKLIKETYKEPGEDLVPNLTKLDEKIKTEFANADLETNKDYELALLKRELISRVGNYALKRFLSESELNKQTYTWLTSDVDNLRLYILGGTPDGGNYYNSLVQLARLYDEYKEDFTNTKKLNNVWYPNLTYGELYKKMAMSIALTHTQRVGLWMQSSIVQNQSDALRRYAIYKYIHKEGKFKVNDKMDYTPWFESLRIEEMRFIMNNAIDDEEILWLNTYVENKILETGNGNWITPHPHMAYVWPNYGNPVYYAEENRDYFNELFAVRKEKTDENKTGLFDLKFTIPGGKNIKTYDISITRGTSDSKIYKLWMNFRNKFGTGAVCGGISKSGSNIRTTHGIPATVIGQPGHAALLCYSKNTQGKGYWGIDNDVSGWTLSEKGERMLLGWGNASYSRGYSVVYMVLAQEAINDFDNLVKCEEEVMRAKVYEGDPVKQEEIYGKALEIQPINIDAWVGLINAYNANGNKTEDQYYDLAEELAEKLKCFPLPMQHLTNLIKPKLQSIQNVYKFTLLQTRILTEGSKLPNTATDQVLQPSVTRVEANYLLGKLDKSIATFSFDGVDAGKIVLSSRFDGNGVRWDYSLDGKQTWNEVSFTAEEEHKLQLTQKQINSITSENDIYVHIVGVNYDEQNLYKIDITEQTIPDTYFANDLENRIVGVDLNVEWRLNENDKWTSYSVTSPDLTGDKNVEIRIPRTGTKLASDSKTYSFTKDNQPDTRKYIPVSHLSIHSVSTEAVNNAGAAKNSIDANYNTRWHSAWNGSDTNRFIVIKLDRSVILSAVEFVPAGGGNGKIYDGTIYGSMDGENWQELKNLKNLTYTNQANTIQDAINNTKSFEIDEPKEVQYIKIVADRTNGNWFTARAFNLYQDLTKNPHPTAGVAYSTTESTNGVVVARLVNPSTEITITNNDGNDTYTFTENGEFTFEFVDKKGITGSATAKVNWIDKDNPTADVDYKLSEDKKLSVILDNISEDVYILDKDNNKINYIEVEDKKVTSVKYLDTAGDIYKETDVDEDGNITKITYKNTTGNVTSVREYVTTIEDGKVVNEEYIDAEGNSVTIEDSEKEILRTLRQQTISNPLEYYIDKSGDYEYKFLDKASNIAYKSIKADYIDDNKILVSDLTYDVTRITNKDVIATVNSYVIDSDGKKTKSKIVNNNGDNKYTFEKNGDFTFEYSENEDEASEVKKHQARVRWIDKDAPTGEFEYSTKSATKDPVTVKLIPSEEVTIINNNGNDTYTFKEMGSFTFEFIDKAGNKGSATAKVDWIEIDNKDDKDDNNNNSNNNDNNNNNNENNNNNSDNSHNDNITITSKKYKIEKEYISRIVPKTNVKQFKQNVQTNGKIVITDKKGKTLKDSDRIKTGAKIKVGDKLQYTLVVTGDVDGDGEITINDLAKVKLHCIELKSLKGAERKAADVDNDGGVTINDLAQIKLVLINLMKIK